MRSYSMNVQASLLASRSRTIHSYHRHFIHLSTLVKEKKNETVKRKLVQHEMNTEASKCGMKPKIVVVCSLEVQFYLESEMN